MFHGLLASRRGSQAGCSSYLEVLVSGRWIRDDLRMHTSSHPCPASHFTHSVQQGNYRFSLLADGLVRIEYGSDHHFENRPSFVALTRPAARPFQAVRAHDAGLVLESEHLRIHCADTSAPPTGVNLRIEFCGGVWNPDTVDEANLGGCHCSLDCINEELIPCTSAFQRRLPASFPILLSPGGL